MRQGATETETEWVARRRRRSALLSALAAGVTAALFAVAGFLGNPDTLWLILVPMAPVVVSLAAAYQYRWKTYTGAGAAAAVVFWIWVVTGRLTYGTGFVIGAVLQTCAWYISRPGRSV